MIIIIHNYDNDHKYMRTKFFAEILLENSFTRVATSLVFQEWLLQILENLDFWAAGEICSWKYHKKIKLAKEL